MVKIEFTPLSLDRKIFPFKKGFKKVSQLVKIGHSISNKTTYDHFLPKKEVFFEQKVRFGQFLVILIVK